MSPRLDAYLVRKYPNVFADRNALMTRTAMCWGFECGNGWYGIIKEAAEKLEPIIVGLRESDPKAWDLGYYRASQIKEKFGTLRFYLTAGTEKMWDIVREAEKKSTKVCEMCGKPGKLRGQNWYYTACSKHTRKDDYANEGC